MLVVICVDFVNCVLYIEHQCITFVLSLFALSLTLKLEIFIRLIIRLRKLTFIKTLSYHSPLIAGD